MKRLTPTLREFCEKEELLRLAYVDRGHPRVVPVWFVVIGRDCYVGTYANSPKWKAIKRVPRVGWVISTARATGTIGGLPTMAEATAPKRTHS